MDWRQAIDIGRVLTGDRELHIPVIEESTSQYTWISTKVGATQRILDRDFPDARRAEVELVLPVAQLPARCRGEPIGLPGCPEKGLRIQQELHSSAPKSLATSFAPMVLKSRGTVISPDRNPSRCAG